MRDAPFAGGRGGSPAAAGQGRCRTRGRRTRGGSSPSCGSPPFCFGRRTLCCRKAPLTGTAAKIREPCGRPVRVVVRERRISWVGAPVLPLGCGKAGFVLFGKRVEAVWRYLPLRAQRVLKEGEEIDKRRGNHGSPSSCPPAPRRRTHPAARRRRNSPVHRGVCTLRKEKYRPRRAGAKSTNRIG
mgnify:FL=1